MNVINIPFHDYKKWLNEGYRTRDAHLFQNFEKKEIIEKILIVNRPVSLAEIILKKNTWKTPIGKEMLKGNNYRLVQISDKAYCLDIFINDFFKVIKERKGWWFSAFNYQEVHDAINQSIKFLNMDDSILLLQNPMATGVIGNIRCKYFVFDSIDNWLFHPQMKNKEIIKRNYEYVDKKANLILMVSDNLKNIFNRNNNVHWIPNGVDVEYFKNSIKDKCGDKIKIGYVGKIQERVDFELVELCIRKYVDYDFIFVGPILSQRNEVAKLKRKYNNIDFIGDVHFSKLPNVMKEFDICIIPDYVNEFTQSMNPLKVYEYLAAGKPVITTEVAGTSNISKYVYSENSRKKFIDRISITVEKIRDGKILPQNVIDSIPNECMWEERVNVILRLFTQLYMST